MATRAASALPIITNTLASNVLTVATLPVGTVGQRAFVTDALAPVGLSAVVGAGTVKTPVFHNGTTWIVG